MFALHDNADQASGKMHYWRAPAFIPDFPQLLCCNENSQQLGIKPRQRR
jgi:hypothetical protein